MMELFWIYVVVAFFVSQCTDEEGFDAAAKGLLWPMYLVIRMFKMLWTMIKE